MPTKNGQPNYFFLVRQKTMETRRSRSPRDGGHEARRCSLEDQTFFFLFLFPSTCQCTKAPHFRVIAVQGEDVGIHKTREDDRLRRSNEICCALFSSRPRRDFKFWWKIEHSLVISQSSFFSLNCLYLWCLLIITFLITWMRTEGVGATHGRPVSRLANFWRRGKI